MKFSLLSLIGIIAIGVGIAFSPVLTFMAVLAAIVSGIIWKSPSFGIVLVAFFLPFERLGALEFSGLTIRLSQILVMLTFVSFFTHGLLEKKIIFRKQPLFWPILAFLSINLLSLINAPNLQRSIIVLAYIAFTLGMVLFIPLVLQDKKTLHRVIGALFLSFTLVTFFGIFQFLGDMAGLPRQLTGLREIYTKDILGFTRVQSTALEPLYFANYLLIPLGLLFSFLLGRSSPFRPFSLGFLFVLGMINLILTASRGGYIAFVVVLVLTVLLYAHKILSLRNVLSFTFITVIVFLLASRFLNIQGVSGEFFQHAQNIFSGASYEERIETIELAHRSFSEHPWIGIGVGSFGPVASNHPYMKPGDGWKIVNNETLEILAETGILGLVSFLILVLTILIQSIAALRKTKNTYIQSIAIGMAISFAAILVQYQTFSILYIMHIWFLVGLLASVWNIIDREKEQPS